MNRAILLFAAVNGILAVGFGAFGAHGLDGRMPAQALGWLETGSRYQLVHAAAGLALGLQIRRRILTAAGWAFGLGGLVFGGSLYLMAMSGATWLGMITPLGGVGMIAGWTFVLVAAARDEQ